MCTYIFYYISRKIGNISDVGDGDVWQPSQCKSHTYTHTHTHTHSFALVAERRAKWMEKPGTHPFLPKNNSSEPAFPLKSLIRGFVVGISGLTGREVRRFFSEKCKKETRAREGGRVYVIRLSFEVRFVFPVCFRDPARDGTCCEALKIPKFFSKPLFSTHRDHIWERRCQKWRLH